MKQGLILIDIQNDYFVGGNMELVAMEQAAKKAEDLLAMFRDENLPIFHVQHLSAKPGATFFIPETNGAEINESVAPLADETVVQKHFPNSFRETTLLDNIEDEGIRNIVICGAMSHMCIDATTRAAFDLGFNCTVVEDACATRNLEYKGQIVESKNVHAAFMAALASVYANVVAAKDFRFS
jgi:nicotinamidase-related amidase